MLPTEDVVAVEILEPTREHRPVEPHDLFGSMLTQLGIDPDGKIPNPRNLDVSVMPPSKKGRGVGRLTELMT